MAETFTFKGHAGVGFAFRKVLETQGYSYVEAVEDAAYVLTYCTSQTQLEDVYLDSDGLISSSNAGTYLIDFSPSTPNFAKELNAIAAVNDVMAVEAPLVAKDLTALLALARENLTCFVADGDQGWDEVKPILEALFAEIKPTGPTGSAQLAKGFETLQVCAALGGAVEAYAFGNAFAKALPTLAEAARQCQGITPSTQGLLDAIHKRAFESAYTIEMLMADLTAALTCADDIDLILPQAESIQNLLELLAVIGGADKGAASLALIYEDEESCAKAGLDWSRAETAFGVVEGVDDYDDDDDYGDFDSHSQDYRDFGFDSYSAN